MPALSFQDVSLDDLIKQIISWIQEFEKLDVAQFESELSKKIVSLLAVEPSYHSKIARDLGVHEQVIFYHIRKLEKAHVIKILKREGVRFRGEKVNLAANRWKI